METPLPELPPEPGPRRCLNCASVLHGAYCHTCGQEDEPTVLALGTLLKDLWETFLAVDAKLLRTLGMLVAKPGMLTCEYLAGRRARTISPFKLYFWATALFVLFAFRAFYIEDETLRMGDRNGMQIISDGIEEDGRERSAKAAKGSQPAAKGSQPPAKDAPETKSAAPEGKGAAPKPRVPTPPTPDTPAERDAGIFSFFDERPVQLFGIRIDPKTLPTSVTAYEKAQLALDPARRDSPYVHFFKVKVIRLRNNRYDFVRNLIYGALPNILLFAAPLWAVMMLPFFRRPRRLYIEHLVFTLHGHTVLVLLLMTAMSLVKIGEITPGSGLSAATRPVLESMPVWGSLYLAWYLFVAARRVYRQGAVALLVKGGCLTAGYGCIFLFAVALGALVTLMNLLLGL